MAVGLKPTYGRVSHGLTAFASSLDHWTDHETVRDAAILLEVISGFDLKDASLVRPCLIIVLD